VSARDGTGDTGKDITDPAGGQAEVRGGETPEDWTGPLPETGKPPVPRPLPDPEPGED